jgi:4-hydroxybenzoate polyprenyltransferase
MEGESLSSSFSPSPSIFILCLMFGLILHIRKLAGFVRFTHTVFALPFALAAMAVAAREQHGWPGWRTFLLILAAMACARTCAMAFNRIADRKLDAANPRTAGRHLPTGQISLGSAWTLCLLSAAGLVAASYCLNALCFYLSPVALAVVCFYSLTKRFTDFTHVFLGLALALAPLGAWLAVKGSFQLFPVREGAIVSESSAWLPLLMGAAVVLWLIGFDVIYAIQDYEFDRAHGLHSLVVRWGVDNALKASFLAHLSMVMLLALFGWLAGFRVAYLAGMGIILGCLVLEHWLARKRSLKWINIAFFRLNALISLVFLVVTVAEVVFPAFRLVW